MDIQNIVRENIKNLKPYSSARDEFKGTAKVFLDANENPVDVYGDGLNRYPRPLQDRLKQKISDIKQIPFENIFLGNGSDEPIDLLFRIFCRPGVDSVITMPPTYGMYEVSANINDVGVKNVLLNKDFTIDVDAIISEADDETKMIFVCSPNNPTGNCFSKESIIKLLENTNCIVIVDEAYIDFAECESVKSLVLEYNNLVVLQTFSKAWALAGARLGVAYSSTEIIDYLNKVKAPYNINSLTQQRVYEVLSKNMHNNLSQIKIERKRLQNELKSIDCIETVFESEANFILVKTQDASKLYDYLVSEGVVVRNRTTQPRCENCIRISVGTTEENNKLLEELKRYSM